MRCWLQFLSPDFVRFHCQCQQNYQDSTTNYNHRYPVQFPQRSIKVIFVFRNISSISKSRKCDQQAENQNCDKSLNFHPRLIFDLNYCQRPRINAVRTIRRALNVTLFLFKLNFLLFHHGLVSVGVYALLAIVY